MTAPAPARPEVRTTCPYCGVGCGLIVRGDGARGATVAGDPSHPANLARICSKGSALGETLGEEGRLLHPMLRRPDGTLERISWDSALYLFFFNVTTTAEMYTLSLHARFD